ACGRGAIVAVLRAHGHEVVASDFVDYGVPVTAPGYFGVDFLLERRAPEGTEAIVTNPPFSRAEEFVEHALELCPRVIILLRLAFLESERRSRILDTGTLARVHVFRRRLPMMHRDGWKGPKASSAMAFAWFVWDRDHDGIPTLNRISWDVHHHADASGAVLQAPNDELMRRRTVPVTTSHVAETAAGKQRRRCPRRIELREGSND